MKTLNTCMVMLCILFMHFTVSAQVGIGTTTPNSSSILDMTSTTKGLLPPRMTAVQKNAVASPATGLLIYQTDGTAGFYYYDGTQWLMLVDANRGWGTTGNAGLVDGTNFLGTTDLVPLALKVNNEKSGLIDPINTITTYGYQSGYVNTAAGSTFFGNLSGKANTTGTGNSAFGNSSLTVCNTGTNNSAFGTLSMTANTTGFDNSAFGYHTLQTNITGAQNTAMGSESLLLTTGNGNTGFGQKTLYTNSTGTYNAAFGVNSLRLSTTGSRNVGQGYLSLEHNTTGSDNVGIGYNAGVTNTTGSFNTCIGSGSNEGSIALTNATAIGYSSTVSASNSLVLGGSGANLVKVGFGVSSPTNTLSFDGTAARTIWLERNTTAATAGFSLTLQSGGAYSTGTNLNGGDLNLSSGTSTGTGTSNISFSTSTAGGSGSADNAPTTKMTIMGSGNVGIGITTPGTTLQVVGGITSTSATSGIGYATGAGGTVTQLTSKATAVTLNKNCGTITMINSALATVTAVQFTVNNSSVAANDIVNIILDSGAATAFTYSYYVSNVAAGSFKINVKNISAGSLSEALVFKYVVIKAVNN